MSVADSERETPPFPPCRACGADGVVLLRGHVYCAVHGMDLYLQLRAILLADVA
jgi:hypothetical protein